MRNRGAENHDEESFRYQYLASEFAGGTATSSQESWAGNKVSEVDSGRPIAILGLFL